MILFWALGAGLAALVVVIVLRPLLGRRASGDAVSRKAANLAVYRDQLRELDAELGAGKIAAADHQRAREELQARMLEDVEAAAAAEAAPRRAGRGAALGVGIAVPVLAIAVYAFVGAPDGLNPHQAPGPFSEAQVEAMVERLAAKMRENPDDADGWKMLGRSYAVLGRFADAVDAYSKAVLRAPQDAQLLADFADALAMARGQSLQGEPEKLVLRALEIEPTNLKALALAGTAAFHRSDFKVAADYWERMLPLVPPDSEDARAIKENVAEARSKAGIPAAPSLAKADGKEGAKAGGKPHPGLSGTVRLSQKLRDKLAPGDTLFVFARAAEGPPMPLAILRRKAGELPLEFALNDAMAMAPGLNLSAFPRIVVTARVSKSGDAKAQPGDLQGASKPVANDAKGVVVEINEVVP
jgi:cytochrome c-type biogenesis protein CcmH